MKFRLKSLKKNKLIKRLGAWIAKRPQWLKFVASVFAVSLLTSLLALFLYDRFWGNSPWSNRQRLVKEALAVCENAQTLANTAVDFEGWPLDKKYDLEGQGLSTAYGYFQNYEAYAEEGGPNSADAFIASSWLQEKYAEYFTAQERCDILAEEYQTKYAY